MFKGVRSEYKILGICYSNISSEDVSNTVTSVCNAAMAEGYKIMLFSSFVDLYFDNSDTRGEAAVFELVNPDMLDALVILPESIKSDKLVDRLIAYAKSYDLPTVVIDRDFKDSACILFDYTSTFEKIVRHVIEDHGCRKVNFIAGVKDNEFSENRVDCYKRVLAENGIPFEEERLGYGNFWETPTIDVMDAFMASKLPFPEAIICSNDAMAIAACKYLAQRGYKVPGDVIVTGFDGIELERYFSPRLTTGAVDFSAIGNIAMQLIEKQKNHEEYPHITEIPYSMRISQSCNCEKPDPENAANKIQELYDRVINAERHESFMFSYLAKTMECSSLKEIAEIMVDYGDYNEWFCLNTDLLSDKKEENRFNNVYTQNMNAFLIRTGDRMFINTDGVIFPAKEMLPDLESILEKENIIFFSPLHFRDEVLGYAAVAVGSYFFLFANRRRYISNTNQILENFINRQKLEKVNAELADLHVHDPMTGLYNRRGFYKYVKNISAAENSGNKVWLFSIDMDYLKYINDTFGHTEGDAAIKTAANALIYACCGKEICARFGGDEFAVAGIGGEGYPEEYMGRVKAYLDEFNISGGKPYKVGISCGWAEVTGSLANGIDEFIRTADARMYEDKRRRKSVRGQKPEV